MSRRTIVIVLVLVGIGYVVLRGHRSEEAGDPTHARTQPDHRERPRGHAVDSARDEADVAENGDPSEGGSVQLRGVDPRHATTRAGKVAFGAGRAGRYQLAASADGTATDGVVSGHPARALGGLVTANGQPVANATIYAGHKVVGTGSTTSANAPRVVATTTDANGKFSLDGLTDGDIAVIAEEPSLGRSKAMRVPTAMPDQRDLVLELLPFGALSGTLTRNGTPAEGVTVACQSTTTPNAIFTVASSSIGGFRFDKLAPDSYRVSATLGTQRTGLRLYSKQVEVVSGVEATVALAVEPGSITVEVTAAARAGTLGAAGAWLSPGAVTATTATSLIMSVAAGTGASQWQMIRQGAPPEFAEVAPGDYTACVVPLPSTVHGVGSIAYLNAHADALPAFCQALTVSAAPLAQSVAVVVDIPH